MQNSEHIARQAPVHSSPKPSSSEAPSQILNSSKDQTEWQKVGKKCKCSSKHSTNENVPPRRNQDDLNNDSLIFGTRAFSSLKAVKQRPQAGRNSRRLITGIFISRLERNTTSAQLALSETGLTMRPVKLKTKYDDYTSFHVSCNAAHRNTLLDPRRWPKGALIKPYYESA